MSIVKRKSTQERKEEIVEAALSLSADLGPGRITTEALAKQVGVSHGAIFRHFPTKAAIWTAVFDTLATKMEKNWDGAELAPSPTPCGRLRFLVRAQLSLVVAIPALPSVIFSRELHQKNAVIKKGVLAVMKRFHGALSSAIQAAIDDGDLRRDMDVNDTANLVIAILQGTVLRWSISPQKFDLVGEGEKMLEQALHGLQAP
ncbi:MAG: TetR/AcrR family transcriptional regulator [Rhodospirillaceae bacterium]|nr:TetR/AcrR family transcriptional regulator [Rhodospirillaceae bacterium]